MEIKEEKELKPYTPIERTRCPFRGFSIRGKIMADSKGNQCALEVISYGPCDMELDGKQPNWSKCLLNTEETRKYIEENSEKVIVFPREFVPPEEEGEERPNLPEVR